MFEVQYVRGHIEVFSANGDFLFSADSLSEAYEMMEE